MNRYLLIAFLIFNSINSFSQVKPIYVKSDNQGMTLQVNGKSFMINGMNWDHFPIGKNYSYNLWDQPDAYIKKVLEYEMPMLKKMGVNTIRQYTNIPPKWIQYIYETYGIYTMLNHAFGRYGITIEGSWYEKTDYSNASVKKTLLKQIKEMTLSYKNTPGLLLYLLGNENNYGLSWEGAETQDFPKESASSKKMAKALYQLFNEASLLIKTIDSTRPVAICNGDLQFLDLIKQECTNIDIFGTNMYRGVSFTDAFKKVKDQLNLPILFTEFGADAFNTITFKEDQKNQAYYMVKNWKEIYENSAAIGKEGNAIGGFTFQFSDGWWKHGQTINLSKHNKAASWANAGYKNDYVEGKNNMNEEWFGICAKGYENKDGVYKLYPRTAYYALKEVHKINPYNKQITLNDLQDHFNKISLEKPINKTTNTSKK